MKELIENQREKSRLRRNRRRRREDAKKRKQKESDSDLLYLLSTLGNDLSKEYDRYMEIDKYKKVNKELVYLTDKVGSIRYLWSYLVYELNLIPQEWVKEIKMDAVIRNDMKVPDHEQFVG